MSLIVNYGIGASTGSKTVVAVIDETTVTFYDEYPNGIQIGDSAVFQVPSAGENDLIINPPATYKITQLIVAAATAQIFYNLGDENTALTGGWSKTYSKGTHSFTKEADHLRLTANSTTFNGVAASTANQIDFTDIDTLYVDWSITNNAYYSQIRLTSTTADEANNALVFPLTNGHTWARKVDSIDVSSVSGLHYIQYLVIGGSSTSEGRLYYLGTTPPN